MSLASIWSFSASCSCDQPLDVRRSRKRLPSDTSIWLELLTTIPFPARICDAPAIGEPEATLSVSESDWGIVAMRHGNQHKGFPSARFWVLLRANKLATQFNRCLLVR